ncbi:HugZ family protein [Niveispirillum sp. KHB5.9]|uniref:HugZ family pyridoxamine 5'-phosphate oxidase n=1 Tax=Niveispirillum sp. KHB5.9 TaxID=3400269 RepID=UPI003A84177C
MTDDIGVTARRLMRACAQATLATLGRPGGDGAGFPSPSLVLTGFALDGSPLLLISALAEHTKNLEADPRCGLLFDGTAGHADRLTGPRLSVQGRALRDDDPGLRQRFIARHPSAAAYAGFGDFSLWRVEVLRGHMVAGFGRIHGLAADALRLDGADWTELAARQDDIIGHMNDDHADAVSLYATKLLGQPACGWRLTGIDPDGCDLRAGELSARLDFGGRVRDADMARAELVRLVGVARRT